MRDLVLEITKAEAAEALLRLEGNQYSLEEYPMFHDIFNSKSPRILMKAGRQVSKTITMAADMLTTAAIKPFTSLIYCNASQAQTSSFSTSKLDPFIIHSPAIYKALMDSKHSIDNVYHKRMLNSSEIRLSYFSESADRVRGNSGHRMYLDEVQDILYDAIIDAEECLSAAKEPQFMYAGTSKTSMTTLEFFWGLSTKKEWIIKCDSCGKWNIPSVENIKPKGLSCKNCDTLLDTYKGQWHSFYSEKKKEEDCLYDGFHIPQIILPLHCKNPAKWAKVIEKQETYPDYKFDNEVMGNAAGEASQPITDEILKKACCPALIMTSNKTAANSQGAQHIVAGIDWGGGGQAGTSTTTLTVYAVYPEQEKCVNIYGKIYSAGEPTAHVRDIGQTINRFGVTMCLGDHGYGNYAMSQLREVSPGINIIPVMYTDQAAPYKWHKDAGRYTVNRTVMIDSFLIDLKKGNVELMRWEDYQQFAPHLTCVSIESIGEENGKGRRVWRRPPSKPDDYLHSSVFGWLGFRVLTGKIDFTAASIYA